MEYRFGFNGPYLLRALFGRSSGNRSRDHIDVFYNARRELGPVKQAYKEGNHESQVRHTSV